MTADEALKTLIKDEWQPAAPGRADVPDIVDNPEDGTGVLVLRNNEDQRVRLSSHDKIEITHLNRTIQDTGSNAEKVIDDVQIDIKIAARDIDNDAIRDSVRGRIIGTRDANNDGPTLGGLAGETKRILNGIRKGFKEWDKTSHTIEQLNIRNSNARAIFTVTLEIIERNVEQPLS